MRTFSALRQCAADVQTPTRVLSSASLALSAAVTLYRVWKHRRSTVVTTPIMTLSCAFAGVVALAMLLNSWIDKDDVSLCRAKGLLFQTAATAMIWQWVFNTVALHLMVVRSLPPSHLTEFIPSYLVFVVPSILVSVALSKNQFGFDEAMSFCWIPDDSHRFALFYMQLLLGLIVFVALIPSVLIKVTSKDSPFFLDVVATLYMGLSFLVVSWEALNAVSASNSTLLETTIYSSCALHHLHWSTFGIVMAALGLLPPSSATDCTLTQTKMEPSYDNSSVGEGNQSSAHASTASPTSRAASSAPHLYRPSSGDIPPSVTMSSSSSQGPSSNNIVMHSQQQQMPPPVQYPPPHHRPHGSIAPTFPVFHPSDDLCESAYDSACGTALSVPPDTMRRVEQERAMEAYTHMLLGYVREQLQDEGYDVSSRQMSTFLSTLERSILPTRDRNLNKSVLDSKKLNQMLVEYRRENHASFLQSTRTADEMPSFTSTHHVMDVDERLNKAMERLHRDLPATMASSRSAVDLDARLAAAKSIFDHHQDGDRTMQAPRKNVSFAGSANLDLDVRLAAARAMYQQSAAPSSRYSDEDDEDDDDGDDGDDSADGSSFALEADGDLDAQMEAARARWLAAESMAKAGRA